MPARVQEHVDAAAAVTAEDDRLFAHGGCQVVAGPRDLALVADEEPRAGEDLLELLTVDLVVDEDLSTHDPLVDIDQASETRGLRVRHVCSSLGPGKRRRSGAFARWP